MQLNYEHHIGFLFSVVIYCTHCFFFSAKKSTGFGNLSVGFVCDSNNTKGFEKSVTFFFNEK